MNADTSRGDAIRARIRSAFAVARALDAGPLHVEPVPDGAGIADLLRASAAHHDWKARAADAAAAVAAPLDAAAKEAARFGEEITALERIADHLAAGDPLPDGLAGADALAAKLLAATPQGIAAARTMRRDLAEARRQHDALAGELTRAKSAAAIACHAATLEYLAALGMDDSPDATRVRTAWQAAIATHRGLRASMRARRQTEDAAA